MTILLEINDVEMDEGLNRKILYVLEEDEESITACFYHNDDGITDNEIRTEFDDICEDDELMRVGSVEVDGDGEERWLRDIEVDEDYRRMGIGSTLIRLAIDHIGLTSIACVQENDAYEYDLTGDGESLIAYCVRKGIIAPNMCHFAYNVILSEEASGDPGQSSVAVMNAIPGGYKKEHDQSHYHSDEDESDYPDAEEPDYFDENEPDYPDEDEPEGFENLNLYQGNESLNEEDEISAVIPIQGAISPLLSPSAFFKKENNDFLEESQRRTPSPKNGLG